VSKEARDVITACLKVDPKDRPNAEKLLEFPWFHMNIENAQVDKPKISFLNKYSN